MERRKGRIRSYENGNIKKGKCRGRKGRRTKDEGKDGKDEASWREEKEG